MTVTIDAITAISQMGRSSRKEEMKGDVCSICLGDGSLPVTMSWGGSEKLRVSTVVVKNLSVVTVSVVAAMNSGTVGKGGVILSALTVGKGGIRRNNTLCTKLWNCGGIRRNNTFFAHSLILY